MKVIQFKTASGDTPFDIDAFDVIEDWHVEEAKFSYVDHSLGKDILAKYKKFDISFGVLNTNDQNLLRELKIYPYPQLVLDTVTYTISIESMSIKASKGKMTAINTTPES